jgi:hypothetical protein
MRKRIGLIIDRWRRYKRINVPAGEALFFIVILFSSYWMRLGGIDRTHIPQITFLIATVIPIRHIILLFRLYHVFQIPIWKLLMY